MKMFTPRQNDMVKRLHDNNDFIEFFDYLKEDMEFLKNDLIESDESSFQKNQGAAHYLRLLIKDIESASGRTGSK